ncbi:cholecystokinin receptor type A isoform X2 [Exaiptasia diaphana]|uniref:G-protein coupled receptors family 1 profile domain-containing protein n=1 Tax=Exaiptasia diaphana TaxID=2652724 RepID=A0A913XW61_EXADI|nr:cholecystokinin receptor type A isoform X2 [Exaiptasia diaphana]
MEWNGTVISEEHSTNASIIQNGTRNYGSVYVQEPLGSYIFRLLLYAIIFLLSLFGNVLVIWIVYRTRELHTVTGYLICNLSVADFGVSLFCVPFTLAYAELKVWLFGLAMCKILWAFQTSAIMASVSTLLAISFDRFRSIAYPYEPRISISKVKFIIAGVWILSFFVGLPFLIINKVVPYKNGEICVEVWPKVIYRQVYTVLSFLLTYGLPLPLMAVWYGIVVYKLEKAADQESDKEGFRVAQAKGKVIRMLIMVVVAYFTCFLPYHVLMMWAEFGNRSKYGYFWILQSYSVVLVFLNSCINPMLYYFFSEQFRRGFKKAVCCGRRSEKIPRTRLSLNDCQDYRYHGRLSLFM